MLQVFADQHHMGLYNSLRMLFEDRLGGQLYRPIGTDWLERGFWKMAEIYRNHPATIAQYLGINESMVNYGNGQYGIRDTQHGALTRAVSVDAFFAVPIDIVIATLPMHIESFAKLAGMHPNNPKFMYQIGNAWNVPPGSSVKNVMASAIIHDPVPPGTHIITYHQEFDTTIFRPVKPDMPQVSEIQSGFWLVPKQTISSFVNCFSTDGNYTADWALCQEVEKIMPDWKFGIYGGSCRDGSKGTNAELATAMRDSRFIWHTKYGGDGYGHVIYNSAAVARPMIVKMGYYMGKMGMELMRDGETCIVIDGLSPDQIRNKILHFSEPERYNAMCSAILSNFHEKVDFDREFEDLQHFLETLI